MRGLQKITPFSSVKPHLKTFPEDLYRESRQNALAFSTSLST